MGFRRICGIGDRAENGLGIRFLGVLEGMVGWDSKGLE